MSDENVDSNVTNLNQKRIEKERRKRRGDKIPPAAVYDSIIRSINHEYAPNGIGMGANRILKYPKKYLVIGKRNSDPIFLEVDDREVVHEVSRENIILDIIAYCKQEEFREDFTLTIEKKQANAIIDRWVSDCPRIDEDQIASIRTPKFKGYCWNRLPFDLSEGKTPVFDELFGRMTNAKAVKVWIGSLFDDRSSRHQYVFLYGHGGNGKSSLINFLKKCLNGSMISEVVPKQENRFWTCAFIGKRLVAFPDCDRPSFVTSGLFKLLTGNDEVRMERKGGSTSSVKINSKFILCANDKPAIMTNASDERRAIFGEIAQLPEGTKLIAPDKYLDMLWREAPNFLHECVELYREVKDAGEIPVDKEVLENVKAEAEEEFENIMEKYFVINDQNPDKFLKPKDLQRVLEQAGIKRGHEIFKFKSWLSKKYNVNLVKHAYARFYRGLTFSEFGKKAFDLDNEY